MEVRIDRCDVVGSRAVVATLWRAPLGSTTSGVSQPTVSQYLGSLQENGNATFADPGWLPVRDPIAGDVSLVLLVEVTEQAPRYRIDAVSAQVDDLAGHDRQLVVSGDVAADRGAR